MRVTSVISLLATLFLSACGTGGGSSAPADTIARDEFDTLSMLINVTDNVILPAYENFEQLAVSTSSNTSKLTTYCASIGLVNEANALAEAQLEWRELMSAWQSTELFIVGPVANNSNFLRNRIYSFSEDVIPSSCGIDQAVVLNNNNALNLQSRPVSIRGLGAVEYVLFNTNLDHTCPSAILETQTWNTLSDNDRKSQRCEYGIELMSDISNAASSIVQAWQPEADNFRSIFLNPQNTADSLQLISDALFYVDKELKDLKIAEPLGRVGCTPVDCSTRSAVESGLSANSLANLSANLDSFNTIFFGAGGTSFDDLIDSVGASDLNTNIANAVSSAQTLISDLSNTSNLATELAAVNNAQAIAECELAIGAPENIGNHPACNLLGHIKTLSDRLKTEFILATALEIPERAQSDND